LTSLISGARFLIFCLADGKGKTPLAATIKAKSPAGLLAVRVEARPEDFITGSVLHKMAARAVIRDLETGTGTGHGDKYVHIWVA
jgi:hypothetical protein